MGRVDIVVFPSGGIEVFGRIGDAPAADVSEGVRAFARGLPKDNKPRKFTGYYDAADASDLEWSAYDENNPIVSVPVEVERDEAGVAMSPAYEQMELAQVPAEQRAKLDIFNALR